MITLDSPVASVLGAQTKQGKAKKITDGLGLRTVGDLLHHFPRRYVRTGELTTVDGAPRAARCSRWSARSPRASVHTYLDRRSRRTAYRLDTTLQTDGPSLRMSFFAKAKHVSEWHAGRLPVGRRGVFIGQVGTFRGQWQLTNPTMVLFGVGTTTRTTRPAGAAVAAIKALFPLYPLTKGVDSWDLQRAIAFALTVLDERARPAARRRCARRTGCPTSTTALQLDPRARHLGRRCTAAQRRFRFDEALVTQLVLARRRAELARARRPGPQRWRAGCWRPSTRGCRSRSPAGQEEVSAEIEADLARSHPMNRLLQGEVGSGKTLVALRAMLRVVDSGGQAALLAPTEVLAQQHLRSITAMLGDLAAGGMLGGARRGDHRRAAHRLDAQGRARRGDAPGGQRRGRHRDRHPRPAAGARAVRRPRPRRGRRAAPLRRRAARGAHRQGRHPAARAGDDRDADPAHRRDDRLRRPRGLHADRAPGRPRGRSRPTSYPSPSSRTGSTACGGGCARRSRRATRCTSCARASRGDELEQGETDQPPDDDDEGRRRRGARPASARPRRSSRSCAAGPLAGLRLDLLHGRLPPDEKDRAMRAFAAGETDVLVSTTVIEVGVDVANATTMVLLDADRFGISQLHQLRGRVGRGGLPGLCLLVTRAPADTPARERLDAVAATTDGFELSRVDLEQRREGDVLGRSQSGFRSSLQNLRVLRDEKTIVEAREAAIALLADDPGPRPGSRAPAAG